ncbi:MAG: hypothetical protein DRQ60_01130 [Gammaproteobacteria bacterium]|nr:MAG: hypothetical protein DRQ54_02060 [Gammaproteobacteria bacterium]RLA15116.1 MAG: hypothetical protein DRQ52_02630 [Gammaproteobacteria bacterium]RLA17779.1 MAG: hypothetical protein DRQ60_01130 [Gammaproteobacteria bacterium]
MADITADLIAVENRFMEVNRARLDRLDESLSVRQWELLCAIPALLHLNNPELPGFIDDQVPEGIFNYQPDTVATNALSKLVTGYRYRSLAVRQRQLISIFMMGSSGSIAFTSKSDFDVWVCMDSGVTESDKILLQQKFTKIEKWAEQSGVELHFFIVDPDQFRSAEQLTLSSDSSGTAQRFLLLEEFYRTSILLAGLPPLWWIVPADQEARYDEYVAKLSQWPNVHLENYIDFGPLNNIPVEEFTGAGLWQVFKGIDSPYKSVMKMILMEAYIDEHPQTQLVSLDYKKKVQAGITELERLDPYLLIFEKADAYLVNSKQPQRAELLRHCFYLKIGDHLSKSPVVKSRRRNLRRELMRSYVTSWNWSPAKLEFLDQRDHWRISQIIVETHDIHRELGNSYTRLSRLASQRTSSTSISQSDLHVLGRRLYAALERKPGKVEIVNRNQTLIAREASLLIRKVRTKTGSVVWLLHDQTDAGKRNSPLKRFSTPVELVLWCWLNSVSANHTRWLANDRQTGLGGRELTLLNRFIEQQLPLPEVLEATTGDLAAPVRYKRLLVLVNIGHEPFAEYSRRGLRLASSRSDPLSYGDSKLNTICRLDLVYHSAWGEITCHSIVGESAIDQALQRYLTELTVHGKNYPEPTFFGFSEHDGNQAALRTKQLFASAHEIFVGNTEHNRRLVYAKGAGFGLIEQTMAGVTAVVLETRPALVDVFSQLPPGPMITCIDTMVTDIGDLSLMSQLNALGSIQLFIHIDGPTTHFHIFDEGGAYLTQTTESHDLQSHLLHMYLFVDNIVRRLNLTRHGDSNIPVTFYQLLRSAAGNWQQREVELNVEASGEVINILALAMPSATGTHALSFIFQGEEFSSLEWETELYRKVAQRILSHRKNDNSYPIYITDVELTQPPSGELSLQSIHYFQYKKSIEERLTAAMRNSREVIGVNQSAQI